MGHDLALNLGPFCVMHTSIFFSKIRNIDNYQSIYVKLKFPLKTSHSVILHCYEKKWDENQSNFNFLLHVTGTSNTFWDLTTWKCVISFYTNIYVKLRYIASREVPFLEFHIPNSRKVLWQTHLFTFSN